MSFSFVDYFFHPELLWQFFKVRLLIVPIALGAAAAYRWGGKIFARSDFLHQLPGLIVVTYLGVYHAHMVSLTGAAESSYYAGINLAAYVVIGFLPWRPRDLVWVLLVTYSPYLTVIFFSPDKINLHHFVPNMAFMSSTAFLSVATFLFSRALRKKEMKSRIELETQNQIQAEIISKKTKEGIYLEKLTSQFSPQVIETIKSGELNLNARVRREITCIFIDVENSTGKSVRIDHSTFTSLLEEFFTECVESFLKFNVTVGTYLGDGIMAFTNAPRMDENHRLNALKACLEILERHQRKRHYYFEKWRSEFNVRIGIQTGNATVGFFPSKKRGSYTAIGDTVNFAARLCSRAQKNTLCVIKGFAIEVLGNFKDLNVHKFTTINDIKGFEGEAFELYSIHPPEVKAETHNQCVLCGSILMVESDYGDTLYVKCSQCSYRDLVDKATFADQTTSQKAS